MQKVYAEYQAEKYLAKYVPVAKSFLCKNSKQIVDASRKIKYPLVMKIISKQSLHKTDIGGVIVVKEQKDLLESFNMLASVIKKKKIKQEGILVQEFLNGKEIIIGIKKDPTFGHILALGIGGKYVEVLKDITFRACPITSEDAEAMIDELKFKQILLGARNEKPINRKLLAQTLVKISKLLGKNKKIEELDINPFMINENNGKVADARIVFS